MKSRVSRGPPASWPRRLTNRRAHNKPPSSGDMQKSLVDTAARLSRRGFFAICIADSRALSGNKQ
jgi:hypothetical protein